MTVLTLQKSGFSIQSDNTGAIVNGDGHQGISRASSRPRLSSITPIHNPDESQQAGSLASTQSAVSFEDALQETAWPSYDHGGLSMSQPLLSSCSSWSPFNEQSSASSTGSLLGDGPKLLPAHHAGMAGAMAHNPVAYRPRVSSPLRYSLQPVELQRSWSNPATVSPYQFPIPAQSVGAHEPYGRQNFESVAKLSVPATSQPRSQLPTSVSMMASLGGSGDANESGDFEPGVEAFRDLLPAPRRLPFSTTTNDVCLDQDNVKPASGRKRKIASGSECSNIQGKARKTKVRSPKSVEVTTVGSRKATQGAPRNMKPVADTTHYPQTKVNKSGQSGTVPFLMVTRSRQREVKLPVTEPSTLSDEPSSVAPSRNPKLVGKKVGRAPKKKQGPAFKTRVQKAPQTKSKRPIRVREKEGMPESKKSATQKQGKQQKNSARPVVNVPGTSQKHRKTNANKTDGVITRSSCRSGPSKAIEPAKTELGISPARIKRTTPKTSAELLPPRTTKMSLGCSARAKTVEMPDTDPVESESRSGSYGSWHEKSTWIMRPAASELPQAFLKTNQALRNTVNRSQALVKEAGKSPGSLPLRNLAAKTTKSTRHNVDPPNSHIPTTDLDLSSPNHDSKSDGRIPRDSSSACINCREAHRKCDRKQSTCGRCQLYGLECVFEAREGQSSQRSRLEIHPASTMAKTPRLVTQAAGRIADERERRTLRSRAKSVNKPDHPSTNVGHEESAKPTTSLPQQKLVPIVYDTTVMQQLEALTDPFFEQYEADIARGCDAEISANFYLDCIHGVRTKFWGHLLEGHSPSNVHLMGL